MTKEPKTKALPETPVQAVVDERVEDPTPDEALAFSEVSDPEDFTPPVDRRHESWPHDDVRRLTRAIEYLRDRQVEFGLSCGVCKIPLQSEGRDGGGATMVGCRCAVRRWL